MVRMHPLSAFGIGPLFQKSVPAGLSFSLFTYPRKLKLETAAVGITVTMHGDGLGTFVRFCGFGGGNLAKRSSVPVFWEIQVELLRVKQKLASAAQETKSRILKAVLCLPPPPPNKSVFIDINNESSATFAGTRCHFRWHTVTREVRLGGGGRRSRQLVFSDDVFFWRLGLPPNSLSQATQPRRPAPNLSLSACALRTK